MQELCDQADKFGIYLKVSAIVMTNGKDQTMTTEQLIKWHKNFGFKGNSGLIRKPIKS